MRLYPLAALCAATLIAQPVAAQDSDPVRITRIADRPSVTLDPAKAYLLVQSNGQLASNFLLAPTAEEQADWAGQRAEALAEAIRRHPRAVDRYERDSELWADIMTRRGPRPVMPVEPTEANFSWPDLESRKQIVIGPTNRFLAEEGRSLWLFEVPAGTYTFYSTGILGMTDCACMGTASFPVSAGQVTAVRVGLELVDGEGNLMASVPDGLNENDRTTRTMPALTGPTEAAYDPRIPREMIVPASFTPVERVPNWFGSTINRIMPIPGVLRYERGRAVGDHGGPVAD